ncbi:hypothetical protein IM720_24360 [Pseudomonas fluorescens]|uniref:Transmembrane protein n=1 Tax=Pseudomonas fluorescens TaxID=294 RepID=A0A7M2J3J4_PSEFL|nr:hypothetical protein [Pseudomonas fluorescens]QOU03809.1 hypothetical protein IM720_24360 [Pseudomonas fluorescens]
MNVFKLIALVVFPGLLTTVLIALYFKNRPYRPADVLKVFSLDPDHGLAKQALFWWSICTPAVYFIVFGLISWNDYRISISPEGFKNFITISTLPIALLSLSIPLGVVVARFHSTEQTARQIIIIRHKNNLDAFYSHRKEFFAYFDKIGSVNFLDTLELGYKINPRLHGLLFKGSPENGTPELDTALISQVIGKINLIRNCLNKVILNSDPEQTFTWYTIASREIYWISITFGIVEINNKLNNISVTLVGHNAEGNIIRQRSIGTTTTQAICAYRCVKSYLLTILHFAGNQTAIDEVYENDIEYIDKTGAYMHVHLNGPVIEQSFSGGLGTPWKVGN